MKLHYHYRSRLPNEAGVGRFHAVAVVMPSSTPIPAASNFLAGALEEDLNTPDLCRWLLGELGRVERGDIAVAGWSGNAFDTTIFADRVRLEPVLESGGNDWPQWTCTLDQFKAALVAWKRFLDLPVTEETEYVVKLPASRTIDAAVEAQG